MDSLKKNYIDKIQGGGLGVGFTKIYSIQQVTNSDKAFRCLYAWHVNKTNRIQTLMGNVILCQGIKYPKDTFQSDVPASVLIKGIMMPPNLWEKEVTLESTNVENPLTTCGKDLVDLKEDFAISASVYNSLSKFVNDLNGDIKTISHKDNSYDDLKNKIMELKGVQVLASVMSKHAHLLKSGLYTKQALDFFLSNTEIEKDALSKMADDFVMKLSDLDVLNNNIKNVTGSEFAIILDVLGYAHRESIRESLLNAAFLAVSCLSKHGTATIQWVTKRYATYTDRNDIQNKLDVANVTANLSKIYKSLMQPLSADKIVISLVLICDLIKELGHLESLAWIIEQSRGQNLAALSAICDMILKYPSLTPKVLSDEVNSKHFAQAMKAIVDVLKDPFVSIKNPTVPVREYADIAKIATLLIYQGRTRFSSVGGLNTGSFAGNYDGMVTKSAEFFQKVVENVRREEGDASNTIGSINHLAAKSDKDYFMDRDNKQFFILKPQAVVEITDAEKTELHRMDEQQLRSNPRVQIVPRSEILDKSKTPYDKAVIAICQRFLYVTGQREMPTPTREDGMIIATFPTDWKCEEAKGFFPVCENIDKHVVKSQMGKLRAITNGDFNPQLIHLGYVTPVVAAGNIGQNEVVAVIPAAQADVLDFGAVRDDNQP